MQFLKYYQSGVQPRGNPRNITLIANNSPGGLEMSGSVKRRKGSVADHLPKEIAFL